MLFLVILWENNYSMANKDPREKYINVVLENGETYNSSSNQEEGTLSYNGFFCLIMSLWVIFSLIRFFMNIRALTLPEVIYFEGLEIQYVNHTLSTLNLISEGIKVLGVALILAKIRWGYVLICAGLPIVGIIASSVTNSAFECISSFLIVGILSALLQIKNNGVSAWSILFESKS